MDSFDSTGGPYDGFNTYNVKGWTAINFNQRGDWADYEVNVADLSRAGKYLPKIYVATNQSGGAVEIHDEYGNVARANVPNTGDWDEYVEVEFNQTIELNYGSNRLRVISAGNTHSTWEWNASHINFTAPPAQGQNVKVELEKFDRTGGTFSGFYTYVSPGGKLAINYNQRGDWAEYDITVPYSGQYDLDLSAATPLEGAAAHISFTDGSNVTQDVLFTGNWENFTSNKSQINLSAGTTTMRVESVGQTHNTWEWNADYIELRPTVIPTPPPLVPLRYNVLQAENFVNTGGEFDGFVVSSSEDKIVITNNQRGDWASYDIYTGTSLGGTPCSSQYLNATYAISVYAATPEEGSVLELLVDGQLISTVAIGNTGSWDNYQRFNAGSISVPEGKHTLTIRSAGNTSTMNEWNLDRIEFMNLPYPTF